jgi:ABC-type dipeptide/oligopeptide/nickel transport system permease component
MVSSGMLRRVTFVRTDVSEELSASFIRVARIGELGTTLAVTSNRRTLLRNISLLLVTASVRSSGRLCGLVVIVSACYARGPGFDSRHYQIF